MKWIKEDIDPALVKSLAKRHDIDLLTASIFARRKIVEPSQLRYFLEDDPLLLRNPFLLEGMEDAVDRLLLAADEGEKVLVFGDSDADGVTSTVLMVQALAKAGIQAQWRVPRGEEPYGLSAEAVETFAREGGTLIITVDCGISNHEEVLLASSLGIDVIICDHHHLQAEKPPEALAVIDPKLPGSPYPFRDLAGAGVAYKVACALRFASTDLYKQQIALLSIEPVAKAPADGSSAQEAGETASSYRIAALKSRNMVESARLEISAVPGTREAGDALASLARFLEGRAIFVNGKRELDAAARALFGGSVDIQCFDLGGARAADPSASSAQSAPDNASQDMLAALGESFSRFALLGSGIGSDAMPDLVQLAALGTIADLMPLRDENRIIVRKGVEAMGSAPRDGLRELLQALGITHRLGATEIAWQITPLVNAAGRLGKPEIAVELLLSEDKALRQKAAQDLIQTNGERRKLGSDMWEAVYPMAGESHAFTGGKYVIVGSPALKPGITGLLASRMVNVFKAPSIVAAFRPDGTVVGSVRSFNGLKTGGLLAASSDLFIDFGGHDAAAGFSLHISDWDEFARRTAAYFESTELSVAEESITVDAELPHSYLKPELRDICAQFEPYGEDNPQLVFIARQVSMVDAQIVGKTGRSHLKLTLDFGRYKWPALLWDGAERLERDFSFKAKDALDLVFKVTTNRWNGEEKPQLEILDLAKSSE